MSTFSSHRIGSRATEATAFASSSESTILRSLFELRKSNEDIQHLTFWNCEWSPRILQSLQKILVRDGRRFASIKFFDCAVQSDKDNSKLFEQILRMVLGNNSTTSLVIKGGRLIGSVDTQEQQSYCPLSCPSASVSNALQEELPTNTSVAFLKLSGLDLSSAYAVEGLCNALLRNSTLRSVSLRQCSLDDESIANILQSLTEHNNLISLDLSRNYLGARKSNATISSTMALDSVAEMLQSKKSKLEHLDLSNQYQQHYVTRTDTLPLPQQQIQRHQIAFGNALGALSANNTLKSIDLSENPGCLSDLASVKALSVCLSDNTCLEHVNISDCSLSPETISYLSKECLPFCGTSLKSLVLFGSRTNDHKDLAAASALETGLLSNMTLETLGDLPCDNENESIASIYKRIQHTLNFNKGGRRALRSSMPLAAWSQILTRADNLDYERGNETGASVVFSLLRQGPILMEH